MKMEMRLNRRDEGGGDNGDDHIESLLESLLIKNLIDPGPVAG